MIGTTRHIHPSKGIVSFTRPNTHTDDENTIFKLDSVREGRRLIFQLGTASPELAVEAAYLVAADVAGIDVNAGCPKPFSAKGGMGAVLLRTPDRLCAILQALVEKVGRQYEIGISVKIRLLETAEMTADLVRKLCGTGITGLTVHCRTTPMRPRQRAIRDQLRMIADICREHGVASVMNGDVENRDKALQLMHEYGMDGAMIATAAQANPSCFRSEAQGGLIPWNEIVTEYMQIAVDVENRMGNTKYTLAQLVPGKDPAHAKVTACKSYTELCDALGLVELKVQAEALDRKIQGEKERRAGGGGGGERRKWLKQHRASSSSRRSRKRSRIDFFRRRRR